MHTAVLGFVGTVLSGRAVSYVPQPCTVREVYGIVCAPIPKWDEMFDEMEPGVILESQVWRWPWQRDVLTVVPQHVSFGSAHLLRHPTNLVAPHTGGVLFRQRGVVQGYLWPHKVFPPLVRMDLNPNEPVSASEFSSAIPKDPPQPDRVPNGQMALSKAIADLVNRPSISGLCVVPPRIKGARLPDFELMRAVHNLTKKSWRTDVEPVTVSIIARGYAVAYDHRRRETRWCVIGITTLCWLVGVPVIVRRWRRRALAPWPA